MEGTDAMSSSTEFFEGHFARSRTMVILRSYTPEETVALCERAYKGGAGLVEVPVQSPDAFPSLRAAVEWGRRRGVVIGAGTVTTPALVAQVADDGAAFTVAPGFDRDVAAAGEALDIPHLPGVATPTEVQSALAAGFTWLKAFPASILTPAWITAMRGPFPTARFVVTGGVSVDNAEQFLRAGASGVSFGGSFADADPARVRALSAASA